MKRKRKLSDKKYRDVKKFLDGVFNKKSMEIFLEKDIELDDGRVIFMCIGTDPRYLHNTYVYKVLVSSYKNNSTPPLTILYYDKDFFNEIDEKFLLSLYKNLRDSYESILFQVHL